MGTARTNKNNRNRLRKQLRDAGVPEDVIARQVEELRVRQEARRAVNPVSNRARNHHDARRKMRRRLEAEGVSPRLVEAAVERLRAQQTTARRAGVNVADLEAIYEDTYRQMRLDDRGFKPSTADSVLRGVARATGQTAKAVTRGKTVTKYQHESIERKETQVNYRNLTEATLTLNGAVEGDDFTADDAEELARRLVGPDVVLHRASFAATSAVAGHRRWSAWFTLSAPEADARG